MENIVITGATGFLGRNMALCLASREYRVYAVIRPDSKNMDRLPAAEGIIPVVCPLTELSSAPELKRVPITGVFHFAWAGVNREQIDQETIQQQSAEDSLELLRCAARLGCECFVFSGSRSEYGIQNGSFREDALCSPDTAYGRAKLSFAKRAEKICRENGIRFIHGRIFSVYGADDHPWSLIHSSVRGMLKNEPLSFSAGTQSWNFMYIDDMTDLLLTIYRRRDIIPAEDSGIFNIATDDVRPLREFIEEMYRITESRSELSFGSFRQGAGSALSVIPDMTKVYGMFGWRPATGFSEGIRNMIKIMGDER